MGVEPVFAANRKPEPEPYWANSERSGPKMEIIARDLERLGNNIAMYNKPVFEVKLTRKEREYADEWDEGRVRLSPIVWNRVYAKDKTVVVGLARKDKQFFVASLKTCDPAFIFSGGIHVGSSIKDLERFFGTSINRVGYPDGNNTTLIEPIRWETDDFSNPVACIKCSNGIVTEFIFDWLDVQQHIVSDKTSKFANQQARKIGVSNFSSLLGFFEKYN